MPSLAQKVAIVTGASRGIGREIALAMARANMRVAVAAKSVTPNPKLPGTIHTVADEIKSLGTGEALPVKVDVREEEDVKNLVSEVMNKWGRIDVLVSNASALWWKPITETPMKRYDLINDINARGTFMLTKEVLPHMEASGGGHVITMGPPIDLRMLPGKVGYCISKFSMTLVALGVAAEYQGKGIAGNALWPATMVESYATINFGMGDKSMWRKPSILSDAVMEIIQTPPNELTGRALIDEDFLRERGWKDEDFIKYRCDPNVEPPHLLKGEWNVEAGLASQGAKLRTPSSKL